MSNNNGNDGGAAMGLALVFAAMYFMAIIVYAVACFAAVICTILSFLAWDKPFRLFGVELCTPGVARFYMYSAHGGCWGVTGFVFFCSLIFDYPIPNDWWFYIITGGYSITPWVVAGFFSPEFFDDLEAAHRPQMIDHAPPPASSLPPAQEPFTFAGWDDETPGSNPKV